MIVATVCSCAILDPLTDDKNLVSSDPKAIFNGGRGCCPWRVGMERAMCTKNVRPITVKSVSVIHAQLLNESSQSEQRSY